MFDPKYTISNEILKYISHIEGCREMINNAPLIPAWEKRFAEDAVIRTVHFGTHLEGNQLDLDEVRQVIEGKEVMAKERDIQEVINYRSVMEYLKQELDKLVQKGQANIHELYNLSQLTHLHELTMQRVLPAEKSGQIRQTRVVIKNSRTGEVTFSPPPPIELPFQLEEFFDWLNSDKGKEIHSVLRAGIVHFELVRIHPFVDGNGRVARAFATFVLYAEGYDIRRFFSMEEHFDKDAESYYSYLQKTSSGSGDLTMWLEYFAKSLSMEFERVKKSLRELSSDYDFKTKLGKQIYISDRQARIIRYLKNHDYMLMKQAKSKVLANFSEDTILRDLTNLMKKGIIKKVGRTKGSKYKLK